MRNFVMSLEEVPESGRCCGWCRSAIMSDQVLRIRDEEGTLVSASLFDTPSCVRCYIDCYHYGCYAHIIFPEPQRLFYFLYNEEATED